MSQIKGTPNPETDEARGQVIFFCEASGGAFDGLYKEERFNSGDLKAPARPIKFNDCMFSTNLPNEIDFVRKLAAKGTAPRIIECKNNEEWQTHYEARRLKRLGMYRTADEVDVDIQTEVNKKGEISPGTETVNTKTVIK